MLVDYDICPYFFVAVPEANLQIFPPNSNGGGRQGYQTMAGPSGMAYKLNILICFTLWKISLCCNQIIWPY